MPWCTPPTADQARLALQASPGGRALLFCGSTPQPLHLTCPDCVCTLPQAALAVAVACLFAVVDPLWSHWGANGTWVIVSVMVTLEPTMGGGIRKSYHRVLGTLAGGLAGLAALYLAFAAAGGEQWAGGGGRGGVQVGRAWLGQ